MSPAVQFSIATANVIEPGAGGTANMVFTVTRTGDLGSQLSVGYTTAPVMAQPNVDFTPESGFATFAAGSATADILIPVFGPNAYNHANLTFSVQLTGSASVVGGPMSFSADKDFAVGTKPMAVVLADFNGDGKLDVAVANSGDGTVSILLNTTPAGATTPTFATPQTFAVGLNPVALAVADLNLNGKPDLVVANDNAAGTVSVLMNTTPPGVATLSFTPHVDFATGANPTAVAVGDLNNDGLPDVSVANSGSNSVSVLLNATPLGSTMPVFAGHVDFATGSSPSAISIADVNGDGIKDLAVADRGSNAVSVLINKTAPGALTPAFAAKQDFATGNTPTSVTIGDLNGDGLPDLAVANAADNTVSVLLNSSASGAVNFEAKQDFQAGAGPQCVAIADLNGDGKPDLIVADAAPGPIRFPC